MILLTDTGTQTVEVGAPVTYGTKVFQTGGGECHRRGSGGVTLRCKGIYEIHFSANVSGTAPVELTIEAGGEPLPETVMVSNVAGAQNVATMTTVRNFCEGYDRISVVNTGAAAATVENAKLFVKRIA